VRTLLATGVLVLLASAIPADEWMVLDNVPDYYWYHGCSPTSGGMLIGYWDNQPGYENLYDGDAPMYAGSGQDAIDDIISSPEHNSATYNATECTHDNTPPAGDIGPNSIACFMHTNPSNGSSQEMDIPTGLRRYAAYDDPDTTINESYDFHSFMYYTPHPNQGWPDWANDSAFEFSDLKREIEAGRPMMLDVSLDAGGHSVVAYGWRVRDDGTQWYAVRDTWQDGNSNGDYGITATTLDGYEWWEWTTPDASDSFGDAYYIDHGVYFIPDPDGPLTESSDFPDSFGDALEIDHPVETIYAQLNDGSDVDYYSIWLDSGDRLVALTQDDEGGTASIDTVLYLYDPSGNLEIYSNDFWGSDSNLSYLWFEADEAGWWRISVEGDSGATGYYALSVFRDPVPEPSALVLFGLGLAVLLRRTRKRTAAGDRGERQG